MSATAAGRKALFDVEREKRWRIWLLFGLLLAVIFVTIWGVCVIVSVGLYVSFPVVNVAGWVFTLQGIAIVLAVSLAASVLYWFASRLGARDRLLRAMHCAPLDPGDRYHQRLANVVEEMRIATGARQVECVTVRTLGLNAFAFSDLRGGGVVGVTEGALARLSRNQLQGIVAHEFGHVLSGSYVTVTVSCLLFGIYSTAGEQLEEAAVSVGSTRAAPLGLLAVGVRGWLWLMQLASSVTSAALSRERERQADLAAAHYTRDPLSLAEALRVIGRHPGGAGYIPEGLAPLCIRDTQPLGKRLFGEWRSTHPPLEARVQVLLSLAAASPDEFARQAGTAEERFRRREHWETQPATGRGASGAATGPAGARPAAGAAAVAPLVAPPLTRVGVSRSGRDTGSSRKAPGAGGTLPRAADCPSCGASLGTADYEGLGVTVCPACGGRLVSPDEVAKLLARREVAFTERQQRLADLLATSGDELRRAARLARGRPEVPLIPCPRCARTMMRRHYDYEHAVEVDYCGICDLYWFEKDELEALQLLAERQTG